MPSTAPCWSLLEPNHLSYVVLSHSLNFGSDFIEAKTNLAHVMHIYWCTPCLCFVGPESHCQTILHENTTGPQRKMSMEEVQTIKKKQKNKQNHPQPVTMEHHKTK